MKRELLTQTLHGIVYKRTPHIDDLIKRFTSGLQEATQCLKLKIPYKLIRKSIYQKTGLNQRYQQDILILAKNRQTNKQLFSRIDKRDLNLDTPKYSNIVILNNKLFVRGDNEYSKHNLSANNLKNNILRSIRIIPNKNNYKVEICADLVLPPITIDFSFGVIGVDINPIIQSWAEIDVNGNLINSGSIHTKGLLNSKHSKRKQIIYNAAQQIVNIAIITKKGISLENLKFSPVKRKSKKLNKMLNEFAYSQISSAIIRLAARNGILTKKVSPKYTSQIGIREFPTLNRY